MSEHVKMHKTKARTFDQEMKDEGFNENRANKPTMQFDFGLLPDAKNWENDKKYKIVIEGKQIGMRSKGEKGHVEIEIEAVGGALIEKKKGKRVLRKV